MKNPAILIMTIAALAFGCNDKAGETAADATTQSGGESHGLAISGTIANAGAMQVHFDKVGLNPTSPNLVVSRADADANGKFSLNVPDKQDAGIYRLRVGEQQLFLLLDGNETAVEVTANLQDLNRFQYDIKGCESCVAYRDMMQKLVAKTAQPADIQAFAENTPNPFAGILVAMQAFGGNPTYLETHKKAKARLEAAYPGSEYIKDYDSFFTSAQQIQQPANGGNGFTFYEEANRQPAPDIKLSSPDGKEYSLASLKGKVVLLDFWASWCRPCRMENPNVVKAYNTYKGKGFTVFSVSLDGIDSRTEQMMGGDAAKVKEARNNSVTQWKAAIAQDGLIWPTHVSDLKKWESNAAKMYGVTSIPRAFLIDKQGRIAATGMRGEQLDATLQKLL